MSSVIPRRLLGGRVLGRPTLYTSYKQDMSFFDTFPKLFSVLAILVVAAYLPMALEDDILKILGTGFVLAVGAIGLNLVTGYALMALSYCKPK